MRSMTNASIKAKSCGGIRKEEYVLEYKMFGTDFGKRYLIFLSWLTVINLFKLHADYCINLLNEAAWKNEKAK